MSEEDLPQDSDESSSDASDSDTSTASSGLTDSADQKGNEGDENQGNGQDDHDDTDQQEETDESGEEDQQQQQEEDDSSGDMPNLQPLPVLELKDNPLRSGDGRTDVVKALQGALMVLGYYIGDDGITGNFDDATEDAVKDFQQDSKDWRGNPLNADGNVDDLTSDAINRSLVGSWFDSYQTPTELTNDIVIMTVVKDTMRDSVSFAYSGKN